MSNVTKINHRHAWLKTRQNSCGDARRIIAATGRDIYVNLSAGQEVRASWLDPETAYCVLGFIHVLQIGCGDSIATAIRAVVFAPNGTDVDIHIDSADFDASGAEQPSDLPVRNGFGGHSYQVRAILRECEA